VPQWYGMEPRQSLEVAVNGDRHGFGEIWIGQMASFDAFALAAVVARETQRASIWVGPLALAVRDPVSMALGTATISHLGGRPAHLALGSSTRTIVRDWHGRRWGGNVLLATATIEELRPLLAGERALDGFRLRAPFPGSQIGLAAFGAEMLKVASRLADRLVLNLLTPAQVAAFRARTELPITIWVPAALDPGEEARLQVIRELKAYLAAPAYAEMFRQAGLEDPDQIATRVSAMGSLDQVRERIAAYHAAGAATVAVVPVTAEDPGGDRLLAAIGGDAR
jgi:probable F420-dependent oxidoreductase